MYTDAEIEALAKIKGHIDQHGMYLFDDEQLLAYARALLAGEKAPPPIDDELRRLSALTDAWTSDGYGNGVSRTDYWRSVIAWKPQNHPLIASHVLPPGTVVWLNITEAGRRWQKDPLSHFGILLKTSDLDVVFHSRQALDPAVRPWLNVNGERIECLADSALSSSTTKGIGGNVTMKLSRTDDVVMRFARIPEDIEIETVALVLSIAKPYDRSGTVHISELVPPVEFDVPVIEDIFGRGANYFESYSVGQGALGIVDHWEANLAYQCQNPRDWKKVTWVEDETNKHLRILWNNRFRSGSFSIPIFRGHTNGTADPTEGREVHIRYDVRLADNFPRAVIEGGKFPGFCSAGKDATVLGPHPWPNEPRGHTGTLYAGNGGGKVHGYDGWSARGGYHHRIRGEGHPALGYTALHTYSYHLRQRNVLWHEVYKRYEIANGIRPGTGYTVTLAQLREQVRAGEVMNPNVSGTGEKLYWDYGAPSGLLIPGRWHRVDQVMRINTPGEPDGWLHSYVDGRQVGKIEGMCWRSTEAPWPHNSTLGIACAWFNFYQGGGSGYKSMTEETWIDVRKVAIRVNEWEEA